MAANLYRQTLLPALSLFTSMSTLLCCALPALLVTLGLGAALAGLVANMPWLVAISDHKLWVFIFAGVLLFIATFMQWRGRNAPCPIDVRQARSCMILKKLSWTILFFSIIIYLVGLFFAFVAVHIFY